MANMKTKNVAREEYKTWCETCTLEDIEKQKEGGGKEQESTNSAPVDTSARGEKYAGRTRHKFRKGVQPVGKNRTIWK